MSNETARDTNGTNTAAIPGMKIGLVTRFIGKHRSLKEGTRVRICAVAPGRAHDGLLEELSDSELIKDNEILARVGGITTNDLLWVSIMLWDGRLSFGYYVRPEELESFARLREGKHPVMRVKEMMALLVDEDPEGELYLVADGFERPIVGVAKREDCGDFRGDELDEEAESNDVLLFRDVEVRAAFRNAWAGARRRIPGRG